MEVCDLQVSHEAAKAAVAVWGEAVAERVSVLWAALDAEDAACLAALVVQVYVPPAQVDDVPEQAFQVEVCVEGAADAPEEEPV